MQESLVRGLKGGLRALASTTRKPASTDHAYENKEAKVVGGPLAVALAASGFPPSTTYPCYGCVVPLFFTVPAVAVATIGHPRRMFSICRVK
jgi:hypothetical protein